MNSKCLSFLAACLLVLSPVQVVQAVPEWREPLIEAVNACGEPFIIEQYSNNDYTLSFFVIPQEGLLACLSDVKSHSISRFDGEVVQQFQEGYVILFQAGDPSKLYRLILELPESLEAIDEGWEPKFYLELIQDGIVSYREIIILNPVFLR